MAATDLSAALTCLRVIRGWTQDELAKASGLPRQAVSAYERGKRAPDLKTLERLLLAMGYSIKTLQRVRSLVQNVGSPEDLEMLAEWPSPEAPPESRHEHASHAELHWEVHQLAADAGKAVHRLAQMTLALMSHVPIVTKDTGD